MDIVLVCWLFGLFGAAAAVLSYLAWGSVWLAFLALVLGFFLAQLLYVVVIALLTRKTDMDRPDEKQNPHARRGAVVAGRMLCFYAGLWPDIRGTEKLPEEPFLFVSNHRSMFDPALVMGYLGRWNIAFISKPSNLSLPLVGRSAQTAGFLAIDRENDRNALKTILKAADYLKRGVCSVGIYPEGTRSRDGKLLPFHKGSFKIAQRANAPIAIACVSGSEKLKNGLLFRPHRVKLEILEVLPAERVKAMSTQELADHARDAIERCLDEGEGSA